MDSLFKALSLYLLQKAARLACVNATLKSPINKIFRTFSNIIYSFSNIV